MKKIDYNKCLSTLEKCSWDSANKENMIKIQDEVIDFDMVKCKYLSCLQTGPCEVPFSNDALLKKGDSFYFFEFKNGVIDNKTNAEIKMKVYDSILILSDLEKMNISDTREKVVYILVFNEENIDSPAISRQFNTEEYNEYNQVQPSHSRALILSVLDELSGEFGRAQFGMGRFENFIFKKVYTIPKYRFDYFIKNCIR